MTKEHSNKPTYIWAARIFACLFFTMLLTAWPSARAFAESRTLVYDGKAHTYTADPITLHIDGRVLAGLPMPPVIIEGRTLVPAREAFEALGAVVSWKPVTREVYIGYNGTLIILQIDNYIANIDGHLQVMDVAPKIINDKTMIPLRFASEALGLTVNWDSVTRIASATSRVQLPVYPDAPVPSPNLPQYTPVASTMDMPIDLSTERMPEMSYPETQITGVEVPYDGVSVFAVTASSPVSKVETFPLAGNRIVVDVYNAEMTSGKTEWAVDSDVVTRVRMAQNQTVPDKITRVVFDLPLAATYRVGLSPDRTKVYVTFESNSVTGVRFYTDGAGGDLVDISLTGAAAVNVFHLTKPDRVVIDVPYTSISDISTQRVNGRFTREMRTNQYEAYTARIVLELNQKVQHMVTSQGNIVTVRLSEPTFRNIAYDEGTKTITIAKGGMHLQASGTAHYDAYDAGRYILTLPVDLSPVIGFGEYAVQDAYLHSIIIQQTGMGVTELILNERLALVAQVTDDNANLYIQLKRPKEIYARIVVIDPGHGGSDPGAMYHGLSEKDLNLAISQEVMSMFEQDGRIKAYATRRTDIDADLLDRSAFGNDVGDLFVSIHNNAAESNPSANGTEAYYYQHDYEHLLGISGKQCAELLHARLLRYLGSFARKVEHKNLSVTREATIPAALLEIGFMSNEEEAALLASEEYRRVAAQAIFDGIIEIFELYTPARTH